MNQCQPLVLIQGWESGIWGQEFVWKVGDEEPWGVFWEGGSLAGKGKAGPPRCGYQGSAGLRARGQTGGLGWKVSFSHLPALTLGMLLGRCASESSSVKRGD